MSRLNGSRYSWGRSRPNRNRLNSSRRNRRVHGGEEDEMEAEEEIGAEENEVESEEDKAEKDVDKVKWEKWELDMYWEAVYNKKTLVVNRTLELGLTMMDKIKVELSVWSNSGSISFHMGTSGV